ncbi:MAG: protein kinase, partial [Deltaproteobacteria bacterium]|nr:protein kinase [Deltaproteobacteria bacterium]
MTDEADIDVARTATQPATELPGMPGRSGAIELDVVLERYEIRALLGVGGMGRVYRAYDRSLDEDVALKMLRGELVDTPGMLERFRQEVRLARRVTSPHVVRTFDLGEHGDLHFLTMEYVDGRSLAQLLEHGPLALDEVLRIARGMAAGIAAAHAAGVLHRDLKPDNVLLEHTGRIAITDFGIARPYATVADGDDRFAGTPAYMAPEQVTGEGVIGPPTDIYAFGTILFEMLVGRRAFPGSSMIEVATARVTQPPPDPRALRNTPDQLATLVLRCMARQSAQRFADGAELVAALAAIELVSPPPTLPLPGPVIPTKSARTVALLPLRAPDDLAELADGLAEEIVDALSMTRDLRVRPLSSVRAATRALLGENRDPRDLGETLGVDVIVDGSLRRITATSGPAASHAPVIRITARVIGVADGFQLWASRFETSSEGLLAVGDDIARAVASALEVEIPINAAPARDARATELYLEGKAKLRLHWREARLAPAIEDLEAALVIAPDDPDVLAVLAMGLARMSFQNRTASQSRAVELAECAVAATPASSEAWLALGLARLYTG